MIPSFARILRRFGCKYTSRRATIVGDVTIGERTCICPNAQLIANDGGRIVIGSDCTIMPGVIIAAYGGNVVIGNRVGINPYSVLYGHGGLHIGDNTLIACHSIIIPANHCYQSPEIPIQDQGLKCKGIIIGADVWIGAGVRILDGVTVGKGVVIGAGSVVTKNLTPFGVYVGVPARKLTSRGSRTI